MAKKSSAKIQGKAMIDKQNTFSIASLLSWLIIGLFGLFFILAITFIITFSLLFQRWWPMIEQIRQASELTWSEVYYLASQLVEIEPQPTKMTWLILGTDQLAERGENQPILTDTIMLAEIDSNSQSVTLLSIPRDVWLSDRAMKINNIYQNNLTNTQTIAQARHQTLQDFSQILDLPLGRLIIIDMEVVPKLIDALGGVEVTVETAFTDFAYPRSDVDVTRERDPNKLYETVSFQKGPVTLDGQTALKYMRSRKAQNSEGNDLARAKRQQQVLTNLIDQFMTSLPPESLNQVIQYLKLYQNSLAKELPLTDLLQILATLPNSPLEYTFKSAKLPVFPIDPDGVLIESAQHYSGQWVFEMTSLDDFQKAIKSKLN